MRKPKTHNELIDLAKQIAPKIYMQKNKCRDTTQQEYDVLFKIALSALVEINQPYIRGIIRAEIGIVETASMIAHRLLGCDGYETINKPLGEILSKWEEWE